MPQIRRPAQDHGDRTMQQLAELDLPHLAMETPEFAAQPWVYFAEARSKHPWLASSINGLVVTEYEAIKELMWMDDRMRNSFEGIVEIMGAKGTEWGRFTESQMLAANAEDHRKMRDIFAARFTPRYANEIRPIMRETIDALLDEWVPKGSFDFEDFISNYPISVMSRMSGGPVEAVPMLRSSLEALGGAFAMDPSATPQLEKAIGLIDTFVHDLIAQRRANPEHDGPRDLLDLLTIQGGDAGLSERQIADLIIFIYIAGYDTSKNMLTLIMYHMLSMPAIYQRCAEDLDYCRKVVEEAFRYTSTATAFRCTDQDIEYRGVMLPKDTMLFFPLGMASRDPSAFDEPDRFDPERNLATGTRHIAFGRGKHICLGQYIARAQIQEGLHRIAQRIKHPRLAGEHGWRGFTGTWGLKGLPIAFDAE
jgi:cytochrome P450